MSAIIIAGRSGSSYAAQIGIMVAKEIDALRTIGIEPTALLVLPRIWAQMPSEAVRWHTAWV